jgi:hypothetical protein
VSYPHYKPDCGDHNDLVRNFGGPKPEIVCLCGSTRFVDEFNRQRVTLTRNGLIVLSIEVVTTQAREDDPQHVHPQLKAELDELHKRKIDLADWVMVLNVGGYIGESTRSEVEYAERAGKPISYLEGGDVRSATWRAATSDQDARWPLMPDLRSPAPDHAGMRARLDVAVWAWLAGEPLTAAQQRVVAMLMHGGGCPAGGGR